MTPPEKLINWLFPIFDRTWWRIFQKRVVYAKYLRFILKSFLTDWSIDWFVSVESQLKQYFSNQ